MTFTRPRLRFTGKQFNLVRAAAFSGSEDVMKIERWKRFAFAATMFAFTVFTYQAASACACPRAKAHAFTRVAARARAQRADEVVLHGKGLVRVAGYELNLSFTPEGRFVGFDITAAPA
jgi:hypothetical protein